MVVQTQIFVRLTNLTAAAVCIHDPEGPYNGWWQNSELPTSPHPQGVPFQGTDLCWEFLGPAKEQSKGFPAS